MARLVVREEIRELGQAIEARMREADALIRDGKIIHRNFLDLDELLAGAKRNLAQAERELKADKTNLAAARKGLIDAGGYLAILAAKLGGQRESA